MKKYFILLFILLVTQNSFSQNWWKTSLNTRSGTNTYMTSMYGVSYKNPETILYLAEQTVSDEQATRIDNFITMLKDSLSITALSSKFDVMYLLANQNAALALRNLVKRSHDATAVNSPTFTQWEGFAGNGSSSYLNTNYNASTQGVNFTLNSGSVSVYSRTNKNENKYDMGAYGGATAHITVATSFGATNQVGGINSGELIRGNNNSSGMFITSRTTSTALGLYRNGLLTGGGIVAVGSIPNANIYICTLSGVGSIFSTKQISFAFIGAGLSATEVRKITNCVEAYMDSLGTGVID